jgi:hypothetical protein
VIPFFAVKYGVHGYGLNKRRLLQMTVANRLFGEKITSFGACRKLST